MSLQRQHFLLNYLKTLSVGPVGDRTHDLPHGSPVLNQLSQPVKLSGVLANRGLDKIRDCIVSLFVYFLVSFVFLIGGGGGGVSIFFLGADLGTCVQAVTPLATIPDNKHPVKISLSLKHKENVKRKRKALRVIVATLVALTCNQAFFFSREREKAGKK